MANANASANLANPLPGASPQTSTSSAPQLPHAGKVIQPQPRAGGTQKDLFGGNSGGGAGGPGKPVWGGGVPKATVAKWDSKAQNDFPTAAEVAQGV